MSTVNDFSRRLNKTEDIVVSALPAGYVLDTLSAKKTAAERVLEKNKVNYTRAVMYRTVSNDFAADEPFDYDMLIFFSPSGISSLLKNFPDYKQGDTAIGTFGPTTAKAAKDAGLRVDLEAPTPEYPSITAALSAYLTKVNG